MHKTPRVERGQNLSALAARPPHQSVVGPHRENCLNRDCARRLKSSRGARAFMCSWVLVREFPFCVCFLVLRSLSIQYNAFGFGFCPTLQPLYVGGPMMFSVQ